VLWRRKLWRATARYGTTGDASAERCNVMGTSNVAQRQNGTNPVCGVGRGQASITTVSVPPRPNVSGAYISSARAGGATNVPGVVAVATYE